MATVSRKCAACDGTGLCATCDGLGCVNCDVAGNPFPNCGRCKGTGKEFSDFKCAHCGHTATFHRLGDVTSCGRCGLWTNDDGTPYDRAAMPGGTGDGEGTLRQELCAVLNKHSAENGSDTPDFLLAAYLHRCLQTFDQIVNQREAWYGRAHRAVEAPERDGA